MNQGRTHLAHCSRTRTAFSGACPTSRRSSHPRALCELERGVGEQPDAMKNGDAGSPQAWHTAFGVVGSSGSLPRRGREARHLMGLPLISVPAAVLLSRRDEHACMLVEHVAAPPILGVSYAAGERYRRCSTLAAG